MFTSTHSSFDKTMEDFIGHFKLNPLKPDAWLRIIMLQTFFHLSLQASRLECCCENTWNGHKTSRSLLTAYSAKKLVEDALRLKKSELKKSSLEFADFLADEDNVWKRFYLQWDFRKNNFKNRCRKNDLDTPDAGEPSNNSNKRSSSKTSGKHKRGNVSNRIESPCRNEKCDKFNLFKVCLNTSEEEKKSCWRSTEPSRQSKSSHLARGLQLFSVRQREASRSLSHLLLLHHPHNQVN